MKRDAGFRRQLILGHSDIRASRSVTIAAWHLFPYFLETGAACPPLCAPRRSKVDVYNARGGVPSGQARPRLSKLRYHVAGLWRVFSGEIWESTGVEEWVGSWADRDGGKSVDPSLDMARGFL